MKRVVLLILLCLLLTVCLAVHAEGRSYHIFLINDVPQMHMEVSSLWSVAPIELNKHQFMGFDPIQEYAHSDGIHTLRVYFIPYNGAFTPPASLKLIKSTLSSRDIQTQEGTLNGSSILEGILAPSQNGYGLIVQDTLQYGYFAVIGFPKNGADLSDQDEVIQSVLCSVCSADNFEYSLQHGMTGQAPANEQDSRPAEKPAPLTGPTAELKAHYESMAELISRLEKELNALKATSASQVSEISAMETEAAAISSDAEILLAQLKEAQNEINILSAYVKCGSCDYVFAWDSDFQYCPKCGTARAIPKNAQDGLTEQHYTDLQAQAAMLQERYDGIAALAENKLQALEELTAANAALETEIQKAQSELEKAKADAADLQKQLEEAIEASNAEGKCVNCGYVFPEGSAFNFCPKCGTKR